MRACVWVGAKVCMSVHTCSIVCLFFGEFFWACVACVCVCVRAYMRGLPSTVHLYQCINVCMTVKVSTAVYCRYLLCHTAVNRIAVL